MRKFEVGDVIKDIDFFAGRFIIFGVRYGDYLVMYESGNFNSWSIGITDAWYEKIA